MYAATGILNRYKSRRKWGAEREQNRSFLPQRKGSVSDNTPMGMYVRNDLNVDGLLLFLNGNRLTQ